MTDAEVQAELDKIAKSYKSDAEMNAALASQNTDRATLQKNLYESLAIAKFVDETINKKIVVTPEELSKFYSSNPTQFNHPDIVRISHILIQPAGDTAQQDAIAQERAKALLARLKKGEDFAKLARENSVDASASQGGDVGFMSKKNIAPEYAEAAFSLPVGSVKLIKTEFRLPHHQSNRKEEGRPGNAGRSQTGSYGFPEESKSPGGIDQTGEPASG